MRTNSITRKTMPQEWIDALKKCQKRKFGKYFEDEGYRTCAYNTENSDSSIVQVAPRRQRGCAGHALRDKRKRSKYDEIFGSTTYLLNIVFITASHRFGGVWIYNRNQVVKDGNWHTINRNDNPYVELDVAYCTKVCDLCDVLDKSKSLLNDEEIYRIIRSQYEHMIEQGTYEKIKTWEDLPDWCLWKWQLPGGKVIEGREKQFEEYKAKVKNLKGYVPCV